MLEDTINGDLDWLTESVLVQDAEDLLDEEALLDYFHPADVVALEEGANEAQRGARKRWWSWCEARER